MLMHRVVGPDAEGRFSVGYATPGTRVVTVVCGGCTQEAAFAEATRQNQRQLATQRALRSEQQACGIRGSVYPDLKKGR